MRRDEVEDPAIHIAVVNDEVQYSIWPADRPLPQGWHGAGMHGTKQEVLPRLEEAWADLQPASLRKRLQGDGNE